MRAWLALPLLTLLALPVLGAAPPLCANEGDPARLADPALELANAQALGFDLSMAQPIPLLPTSEAQDNHPCGGKIRPGAQLIIDSAFLCTANWVYEDEFDRYYLGTAGHCISQGPCDPKYDASVTISGIGRIGDVAYSTGNCGVGNDFALIRIYPHLYSYVNAAMCHWGGPTSLAGDEMLGLQPHAVVHYGFGFFYGNTIATRARAGVVHALEIGDRSFSFEGTIAPGDSGSAIQLSSGHVLGIITHGLIAPGPAPPLGVILGLGTRIQHGIALAESATGLDFEVSMGPPVDLTGLSTPN